MYTLEDAKKEPPERLTANKAYAHRAALKMTCEELADAIGDYYQQVSAWENSRRRVPNAADRALRYLLGVHRHGDKEQFEGLLNLPSEPLTKEDVRAIRHRLGLSQGDLGALMGAERTYVSKLERGAREVGRTTSKLLRIIERIATYGDEHAV